MTDRPWNLPIQPPIDPMLAKLARKIPTASDGDAGWLFEPKWDGFRCIVFRDGDRIELFSRNKRPLARYFPELIGPLLAATPERCIVDGEIVVPDAGDHGLDFDALLQRIHPAESRINRLAAETPAEFVAFDVLAVGDETLVDHTMTERRSRLTDLLAVNDIVRLTPASTDRAMAEDWFGRFEGAGLDGVIAKPVDGTYEMGKRSLVKVKHQRTADCAVPGYRVHKDGNGVGSLLLGLYADDGSLRSVGVAAAFTAKRRTELLDELAPRLDGALDDHPWVDWAEWQEAKRVADAEREAVGKPATPSAGSRWNAGKDLSFVPIRMGLVAEVAFGQLEGGRFRHGVKFLRWRPDRLPESCTYDQLDVADPVKFDDLF
ncbi:ATP-dependent DNA ligase [Ilumatobacter coccineus]|uniref:DNA ligase (ATP) n=1 Tax=Ilumatobacter coccineus (strain NBRC 103263 / KCTC 29153 / YM16-304) TaxID=1313172 RepID=A0A6C7ECI6_ILUCY|nr:ATP-dependent DNA ligase [Ilumatobacter coccineus]BAN04033.1 putative ATP-dependent DNA ligase [Ilumatobacter coccineus YM16-304]